MNIKYPTRVLLPQALVYRIILDAIDKNKINIEAKEIQNKIIENKIPLTENEKIKIFKIESQLYENDFNDLLSKCQNDEYGEVVDLYGRAIEIPPSPWFSSNDYDDEETSVSSNSLSVSINSTDDKLLLQSTRQDVQIQNCFRGDQINDNRLKDKQRKVVARSLLSNERKEDIKVYDKERKQKGKNKIKSITSQINTKGDWKSEHLNHNYDVEILNNSPVKEDLTPEEAALRR